MTIIGTAYMEVLPESGGFASKLIGDIKGSMGAAGPAIAGIAAAAVGVGVALYDIGEKFEGLRNKIIQTTGASGKGLEELDASAKRVLASTIGATFANVGDTIGQLAERTGLGGKALEELARKEIELGKITHTEVGPNVEATTALFQKFGIVAEEQAGSLDVLFKAAREGGKGLSTTIEDLTRGQPVLAALGLSFGQQADLMGGLERSGVRAQAVIMGLGKEFKAAAKDGESPVKVIGDLVAKIAATSDPTKQLSIAIGALGAKAGGEFVAAVNSGALSVGNLTEKLGGMNIDQTAVATATLSDKFKVFKNEALVAIAPYAEKFLGFLNYIVDHKPIMVGVLAAITAGFVALGVAAVATAIAAAPFEALFALLVIPIAALAYGIVYAYTHFKIFRDVVASVVGAAIGFAHAMVVAWKWILDLPAHLTVAWGAVTGFFSHVGSSIADGFQSMASTVSGAWDAVYDAVSSVIGPIVGFFEKLPGRVIGALVALPGLLVDAMLGALHALGEAVLTGLYVTVRAFVELPILIIGAMIVLPIRMVELGIKVVTGLYNGVAAALPAVLGFFEALPGRILSFYLTVGTWLLNAGIALITGYVNGILITAGQIWGFFTALPGRVIGFFAAAASWLVGVGGTIIRGLAAGIAFAAGVVWDFFKKLPGQILSALGSLGSLLVHVGEDLIKGLIKGIKNMAGAVGGAMLDGVKDGYHKVLGWAHIGSPSRLFADVGANLMQGLAIGVSDNAHLYHTALSKITGPAVTIPAIGGTTAVLGDLTATGGGGTGRTSAQLESIAACMRDLSDTLKARPALAVTQHIGGTNPSSTATEAIRQLQSLTARGGR